MPPVLPPGYAPALHVAMKWSIIALFETLSFCLQVNLVLVLQLELL